MDIYRQNDQNNQIKQNETKKSPSTPHKIELDHLHSMSVTGVKDVPTFTDKLVIVRLANESLQIVGSNLSVKSLDVESGKLQLSGQVNSLKYSAQNSPTSLVKRIFK